MCAEHLTFFPLENIDLKGREHKNIYFVTLAIKITDKDLKWGHRNKENSFQDRVVNDYFSNFLLGCVLKNKNEI